MRFLRRRSLKTSRFTDDWKDLQRHCATRKTWPQALGEADDLLGKALKQRRFKGKTVGERLVAAQHQLSDNEAVWFSHKFCKTAMETDVRRLRKQDMLKALAGYRQALRDLGALQS